MAYSLELAREWAQNPNAIPSPGSYGEGRIANILEQLRGLRADVKSGKITIAEYLDVAEPLASSGARFGHSLAGGGSKKANAANAAGLQAFTQEGFAKDLGGGNWVGRVPFSAREYAQLPESVLPTQNEVNSGIVPIDYLPPIQRYRPEPPPQQPTAPTNPQVNPGPGAPQAPGGVPAQPVAPPTSTVPDPANPGQSINVPVVGDPLRNSVPKTVDQSVIEQEAARQAEQQRQAFEAERAIRSQRLTDLSAFLTNEENRKFSQSQPGIYEDLNARGLLRSSGLGEALAREKAKLAGDSASVLAQQGLTDRDAEIQGIKDILSRTQQFQTSGLERKFTLEDFEREKATARELGANYAPSVKGGSSVLSGILGGAATGATAGSALGPWGAGAGAIMGAANGAASKGK